MCDYIFGKSFSSSKSQTHKKAFREMVIHKSSKDIWDICVCEKLTSKLSQSINSRERGKSWDNIAHIQSRTFVGYRPFLPSDIEDIFLLFSLKL